jgi:hypothetical protein
MEASAGAVPVRSKLYVERLCDDQLKSGVHRGEGTILVHGPRQVGKTSLIGRSLFALRQGPGKVAVTDFQVLGRTQLQSADCFSCHQNDFDDLEPLAYETNTFHNWADITQPYIKNWDLFFPPLGGPRLVETSAGGHNAIPDNWKYFVQYGYNASYMNRAPDCGSGSINVQGNAFGTPISATSAQEPAATIEFAESGQDAPNDNVGTQIVYGPGMQMAGDVCTYGDWGANKNLYYGFYGSTTTTGLGFFRPRENGGVIGFLDGHAKCLSVVAIAAGTDWYPGQPYGQAKITDRTKYLWDLQ